MMVDLAETAYTLFGIRLTKAQLAALERYEQELLEWNSRFNLTAIVDPEQVRIKHFLDSFSCLLALRKKPLKKVIDVGSGAGFPGLPLKIIIPQMELTLVESVGKKASFCQHIVDVLGLDGVRVIQDRAEVVGQQPAHREQYDWAVARAVAAIPVLMEFLLPLVRVSGGVVAMKGGSVLAEAQAGGRAMHILGGHLQSIMPVVLPGVADERYLVVVEKIAATPPGYPRRVGVPVKKPL